jgi:hypothetical protein
VAAVVQEPVLMLMLMMTLLLLQVMLGRSFGRTGCS